MAPRSNEILAKNNNNFFASEWVEYNKKYKRAIRILEGKEYVLIPVTAEEIYKSKVDVSLEERRKMVEEVKEKGILKNVSEKEIEQALKE